MCLREYTDSRQRQLFKNVIYVGALSALRNIDFAILKDLVSEQFKGKEKAIQLNLQAINEGKEFAEINWEEAYKMMRKPGWVFDSRSIVNSRDVLKANLSLWKIGDGRFR